MDAFAQIRIVLVECRTQQWGWEQAWYKALRQIIPPEESPEDLRDEHESNKQVLAETKPWWRAAYEGEPEPDSQEMERADRLLERRLGDIELDRAA